MDKKQSLTENKIAITDQEKLDIDIFWKNYPIWFEQSPASQMASA